MIDQLTALGLTGAEARIYVALIQRGKCTANELARITNMNRTVTYNILTALVRKGYVAYIHVKSARWYQVTSIDHLLAPIKEKEIIAHDLINTLSTLRSAAKVYHRAEIYEGITGIKAIHREMLNAGTLEILNATGMIQDVLVHAGGLVRGVAKNRIRMIANKRLPRDFAAGCPKVETRYLPSTHDNYATTFLFKNTVVIQILKGEPLIVKIQSKELYEGYKLNFELLWKICRNLKC